MTISWSQVESKFFDRYCEVFEKDGIKASLDSCGKVIGNFSVFASFLDIYKFVHKFQIMQSRDGKNLFCLMQWYVILQITNFARAEELILEMKMQSIKRVNLISIANWCFAFRNVLPKNNNAKINLFLLN